MDDGRNTELLRVKYTSPGAKQCTIQFVGVFHGTEEACAAVTEAFERMNPEAVFLELCESRSTILQDPMFGPMPVPKWKTIVITVAEIAIEPFLMAFQFLLSMIGPDYNSPVCEMRTAHRLAKNSGRKTILGDRMIGYKKMQFGNKEEIANIYDACPPLKKYLLEERNKYMAFRLREIARTYSRVLAVVGSSHIEGIARLLQQDSEVEIDKDELLYIPFPKMYVFKKVVSVAAVATLVGVGIYIWRGD